MLELEHGFRVADVHTRLGVASGASASGPRADADALERALHQAGIVRAAVVAPATGAVGYLRANNAVARHAVDRPFVALARLSGPRDPGASAASRLRNLTAARADGHADPADVERYAYGDRFEGFRLDPQTDGLPDAETLDALADADMPVFAHGGAGFTPAMADAALLDRGITVVQSHFGGHPLDRDLMGGRSRCSASATATTSTRARCATATSWSAPSANTPTACSSGAAPRTSTRTSP